MQKYEQYDKHGAKQLEMLNKTQNTVKRCKSTTKGLKTTKMRYKAAKGKYKTVNNNKHLHVSLNTSVLFPSWMTYMLSEAAFISDFKY